MKTGRIVAMASALVVAFGITAAPLMGVERSPTEAMTKVRRALERLPYYGVFDFLAFGIERNVIVLKGYAHRPALKREAEEMVRHATEAEISNKIELLPVSSFDDRIRWSAFQQIYTDAIADKYVRGGAMRTRYELLDGLRFPGMEPFGTYPVHIVVKNRRMALIGALDNETDKAIILTRARNVASVAGVEDVIMVRGQ